jgi:hypothetical protein
MPRSAAHQGSQAAIDYFVEQGNFKPDTTWKWQPWGLFAIAAVSIELLGTDHPRRAPSLRPGGLGHRSAAVPPGAQTVRQLPRGGALRRAAGVEHLLDFARAPVPLLFRLEPLSGADALLAYARWQWGGRSAAAFIAAAWCWFQVDYGTVLPVLAVLFLEALKAGRPARAAGWRTVEGRRDSGGHALAVRISSTICCTAARMPIRHLAGALPAQSFQYQ